jgi:hypothetical protein
VENWIDQHPEIWTLWEKVKSWFNQHPEIWILTIAAIILVSAVTTGVWRNLARLTLLVLLLIFLTPFLPGVGGWVDRVFNHGDWSASSDYEPRTVYGGTVTFTRIGQVEEFYAKGEVLLKNQIFSQASCLAISPLSKFFLNSLEGNRKNFLTPRSSEKEWVMVEARRAGTCPNPQT